MTPPATAIAPTHHFDGSAGAVHDAEEIDGDHGVEQIVRLGGRVARTEDPGVVDPHIRLHRLGQRSARICVTYVEMLITADDVRGDDVIARCPQPLHDRGAETSARARDDRASRHWPGHQVAAVTPLPRTTMPPSLTV